MNDAVNSLRIVLAADESIRTEARRQSRCVEAGGAQGQARARAAAAPKRKAAKARAPKRRAG